jgi:hypothetical protein
MKTPRLILPVLLVVTGFTCWLSWLAIPPQASQARIRVESDLADIRGTPSTGLYDSYFIPENNFTKILIPASKPK